LGKKANSSSMASARAMDLPPEGLTVFFDASR
jgi:hypothetical protein